ncbi:grasp-with-spasm system ATP-grasp peptide maturase [Taibaiella koreensis]|uniref:grasp-with-spasm system ATP-grasp peptide maturase n=1 Tax=Taibaiella koreensis TaxID=1268548 RepID=UPI000E59C2BE|nr:grasp-with-spasm system ATP-grasp peptide maturase [Taibaiella koreensis]
MVLILSASNDVSTDYVIEWFRHYKIPCIRLNERDTGNILASVEFRNGKQFIALNIKGQPISMDDITGVWFRRSTITFTSALSAHRKKEDALAWQIAALLDRENRVLTEFIATKLSTINALNNQLNYNTNKLLTLMYAQEVGLKIPHTLIATVKDDIRNKLGNADSEIITKPIQDIFWLNYSGTSRAQYTAALSEYSQIPDRFYYSLFQERIEKKYELRIFFIEEKFYACAIFSKATEGRNVYQDGKMVRMVPFSISNTLKEQLVRLSSLCKLNSGSVDLMVDKQGDCYFLEINPVGQFGYISKECNYHLDQKIAKFFQHEPVQQ